MASDLNGEYVMLLPFTAHLMLTRLHAAINREESEELLRKNGMFDGLFLVRDKLFASYRVVFVLSLVTHGYFRHHLLERRRDDPFQIDNRKCVVLYANNAYAVSRGHTPRMLYAAGGDPPAAAHASSNRQHCLGNWPRCIVLSVS